MKTVLPEVRDIGQKLRRFVVHGLAGNDPAHVGPEAAISWRVWIPRFVGGLMVNAVRRHPWNGATLERQGAANSQEVLNGCWCFVAPVSEQAVVANADAEASGYPPQQNCHSQRLPAKHEQRGGGADVEHQHEKRRNHNHRLREGTVTSASNRHVPRSCLRYICRRVVCTLFTGKRKKYLRYVDAGELRQHSVGFAQFNQKLPSNLNVATHGLTNLLGQPTLAGRFRDQEPQSAVATWNV